jgi:hypothetical protein
MQGLPPKNMTSAAREVAEKVGSKRVHSQRHGKFQISDLKFQMEETANANSIANANSNADPSSLKGIRDDSVGAFFRGL